MLPQARAESSGSGGSLERESEVEEEHDLLKCLPAKKGVRRRELTGKEATLGREAASIGHQLELINTKTPTYQHQLASREARPPCNAT